MKENTSPQAISTETRSGWSWLFGIAFVAVCLFVALSPFRLILPQFGLDPSWIAVLGEAPAMRIGVGRDIIFTGGPLSAIYTHWFSVDRFPLYLGVFVFLIITLSALVASLARQHGRFSAAILFGVVTLACASTDSLFFAIPTLTALVALSGFGRSIDAVAVAGGLIATAIVALAKFSVAPLAVLSFLICDIALVRRRRMPRLTVGFGITFFAAFSLLEAPESFIEYIRGSIIISAGYSEAMGIPGSLVELIGFGAAGIAALSLVLFHEFGASHESQTGWPDAAARCLVVSAMVFISFKAGFVRQDLHTLVGWSGLALAASIYALAAPGSLSLPLLPGLGLFIALIAIPLVWSSYGVSPAQSVARWRSHISRAFNDAADFVKRPSAWIEQTQHEKELAWDRVRKSLPLPKLAGTVDTLPSIQSSILAHGLQYQPRWNFQDYASYAVPLSTRNLADIENHRPDFLFFDPAITNIDGRYPALAEGPLWPFLLSRYAPVAQAGSVLILKRLVAPDPIKLFGLATASTIRFGETLPLSGTAPVFLTVKINKTIIGRLANILFRPSLVHIRVKLADGSTASHRIIPGMAAAGFIVSPYMASSVDYAALSLGQLPKSKRVVGVSFESGRLGGLMYGGKIALELREVQMPPLDHIMNASPETRKYVDERFYMMRLASNPGIRALPQGLLAHAPHTADIAVDKPASRVIVGFGLVDQAWDRPDGTDGVCFNLSHISGGSAIALLQRCLDPIKSDSDRGEQVSELPAALKPGDILRLETSCNKDCRYDWSYWSRLSLENH